MCTVLLPPGVNPIAVNKYINDRYQIYKHGIGVNICCSYRLRCSNIWIPGGRYMAFCYPDITCTFPQFPDMRSRRTSVHFYYIWYNALVFLEFQSLSFPVLSHSRWTKNCSQSHVDINLLKTKRNLLYIRNQSVPRCKHFPQPLFKGQT